MCNIDWLPFTTDIHRWYGRHRKNHPPQSSPPQWNAIAIVREPPCGAIYRDLAVGGHGHRHLATLKLERGHRCCGRRRRHGRGAIVGNGGAGAVLQMMLVHAIDAGDFGHSVCVVCVCGCGVGGQFGVRFGVCCCVSQWMSIAPILSCLWECVCLFVSLRNVVVRLSRECTRSAAS